MDVDVPPHALSSRQREEEKSIFYTKNLVIKSWPASAATHTQTDTHLTYTHMSSSSNGVDCRLSLGKCLDRLCLLELCMMA